MRQALHIFRKDAGRLWIELCISFVALALLTRSEWLLATPERNPRWYNDTLPAIALFLTWWALVVRLVQGETLVGDRQFWTTRPYIWYKLLASKVLFVIVFLAVPSAISEMVLVVASGSPVAPYLSVIFRDTALIMLVAVLPIAALAVITRNFGQCALYAVVLILAVIGLAAFGSSAPNSQVPAGSDVADMVQAAAVALLGGTGILVQYAFRRTLWATIAVIAALVSLPLIIFATPYRRLIELTFPTLGSAPMNAVFGPAELMRISATPSLNGEAELTVPVELSASSENTLGMVDAAMLSIDIPHGRKWASEWRPVYSELIEPTPRDVSLHFQLDRTIFASIQARPALLRMTIAFSQFKDTNRQTVAVYRHFNVAGVGPCWIERFGHDITCRSTEIGPSLLLASAPGEDSVCSHDPAGGCIPKHVIGLKSSPGPLSPLAVQTFSFDGRGPNPGLAPLGEKLLFSAPEQVRRFRIELTLGQMRLSSQRTVAVVMPMPR